MLSPHFRVVRVERRNYSVSGTRPSPITWDQEVGDVGAVIAAVGGRCHLFGHSAGALVALHVARRRPELIDKLALYEPPLLGGGPGVVRSEEHTSELQSLMRISYAVFCLKKKIKPKHIIYTPNTQINTNQT